MMDTLIEIKELSVDYAAVHGSAPALDKVSLRVNRGEIMGVVGESGSGKSTLALALLRLLPDNAAVSGKIFFEARDIFSMRPRELRSLRRQDISMVFQAPAASFNPVLSIEYQFRELLQACLGRGDKAAYYKKMTGMLEKVRLPDPERALKSYPHQLSGGQLQRVALAFALSTGPKVLIADEPTSSLDVTVESQIVNLLKTLKEELDITIVFITHNLDLVNILCDRVCVLYKGIVRETGPKEELFTNPSDHYTKTLLDSLKELG